MRKYHETNLKHDEPEHMLAEETMQCWTFFLENETAAVRSGCGIPNSMLTAESDAEVSRVQGTLKKCSILIRAIVIMSS